jgi:prephenate dehydratase
MLIIKKRLNAWPEEADDTEIISSVNECFRSESYNSLNGVAKNTLSIIFSLKNRVGGLARALKVFEENGINVVHIESRKSKRTSSEYEIFVNLETTNGKNQVPRLVKSLKKQLSYVKVEGDQLSKSVSDSMSISNSLNSDEEKSIDEEVLDDELLSSTTMFNTDGVLVRKSN